MDVPTDERDADALDDDERSELHAAIRAGIAEMKVGETHDAADVIAELRAIDGDDVATRRSIRTYDLRPREP